MDLYRLSGSTTSEFAPLNLPHVFSSCLSLVEWPMRLPAALVPSERRLDVTITHSGDDTRKLTMEARDGPWNHHLATLEREGYLDDLLIPPPDV